MMVYRHRMLFTTCLVLSALLTIGCGGQSDEAKVDPAETATVSADSMKIELNGRDSVSVYDLLLASHEVEADTSSMGILVLGIDSVKSSAEAYWMYRVNDSLGMVACDQYMTSDGDRVSWHLTYSGK